MTGFFSGIVNGVKGLLGINSPSKVFSDQVGTNMALGVGEGFEKTMGGVKKDMENALPTEFDLPTKVSSDVSYSVMPVVADVNTPPVSDVSYKVNPVVGDFNPVDLGGQAMQVIMVSPELIRFLADQKPADEVNGPDTEEPDDGGDTEEPDDGGDTEEPDDGGDKPKVGPPPGDVSPDGDFPASPAPVFSPNIVVHVYGEVSEETVDNMRDSLRDTVRELYDEFREEELQQMSLKNQYSF